MLKGLKEKAIAAGLKSYLREKFGEYGEILDCNIDTSTNRVELEVLLKGESDRLHAAIERYDMAQEDGAVYMVVRQLSSSREWLTLLLNKVLAGKRFKLPGAVARLL